MKSNFFLQFLLQEQAAHVSESLTEEFNAVSDHKLWY